MLLGVLYNFLFSPPNHGLMVRPGRTWCHGINCSQLINDLWLDRRRIVFSRGVIAWKIDFERSFNTSKNEKTYIRRKRTTVVKVSKKSFRNIVFNAAEYFLLPGIEVQLKLWKHKNIKLSYLPSAAEYCFVSGNQG